jgi:transcriptional regulator with XRE-family HTH domain
MGRSHRLKPKRLARKLQSVRMQLDLTQEQLIERLNCKKANLYPASISMYEAGTREPPLPVLLRYARIAGVPMELLVDDNLDLPDHLPSMLGSELVMKVVRSGRQHER